MQITGTIKQIFDTKIIGEKKFRTREFILSDDADKYPQVISFQFTQDKCAYLDSYKRGENVTVTFNLRGREWTSPQGETKYFNTLEAWKIERNGGQSANDSPQRVKQDDLPF